MAKFKSYDGLDADGVRAEVMVQTGSGTVKSVTGHGNPRADGTHRTAEVVFNPDNPHLKRKVYASLDTTATELYEVVQEAFASQRTVEYRIESVRRKNVDRSTPFENLTATTDVIRVLAAIDDVFSHEARTDPLEDPDSSAVTPSALQQRLAMEQTSTPQSPSSVGDGRAADRVWVGNDTSYEMCVAGLSNTHAAVPAVNIIDMVQSILLSRGTPLSFGEYSHLVQLVEGEGYGTRDMTLMVELEQYTLSVLSERYGLTGGDAGDDVFSQSTGAAEELLRIADAIYQVLAAPSEGTVAYHRGTPAYRNVLNVVKDTMARRETLPIFTTDEERETWREDMIMLSRERLEMMKAVVAGTGTYLPPDAPLPTVSPDTVVEKKRVKKTTTKSSTPHPTLTEEQEEIPHLSPPDTENVTVTRTVLGAETIAPPSSTIPVFQDTHATFVAPSETLVARLKTLCVEADVMSDIPAISEWMRRSLGRPVAKTIHADNLTKFVEFYESAGPDTVRVHVLASKK